MENVRSGAPCRWGLFGDPVSIAFRRFFRPFLGPSWTLSRAVFDPPSVFEPSLGPSWSLSEAVSDHPSDPSELLSQSV